METFPANFVSLCIMKIVVLKTYQYTFLATIPVTISTLNLKLLTYCLLSVGKLTRGVKILTRFLSDSLYHNLQNIWKM
jgi:hypothetical protein